jgi:uncharacterized protein YecE (DUF72 family)
VVEINSSFYRTHRPATYARWAASVPAAFRFSVKLPRAITHDARLREPGPALRTFFAEAGELGARLGCVLAQLPPSLELDRETAPAFLAELREVYAGPVVLEPRHESWFTEAAEAMLAEHGVGRVAADPPRHAGGDAPAGASAIAYHRLHGSPRMYYSAYPPDYLDALARRLRALVDSAVEVWCIFDNTAHGHATFDALGLIERLAPSGSHFTT